MCGICGIFDFTEEDNEIQIHESEITAMMNTLKHRGPDDSGLHIEKNGGLGHRRLSIIDLSSAGRQPMSNEDRSIWITYNGEFYNYADFIDELKRDGHQFRSLTDTEVIIHLYEKYGLEETISRMNGMFAFCLWDKKKGKQYLVRDRLGIKPLYYHFKDRRLAFSSEIKAFYQMKDFIPKLRDDKLAEYFLYFRSLDNATLLSNIFEVRPGTYIEIDNGDFREVVYYDLNQIKQYPSISESEALHEFDRLLERSIKRRLVSDVPVGVFLSGGVDSTIIAIKTAEIVESPINTISVAYPEKSSNEFYWSDQVTAKIKSNHRKVLINSNDFLSLYPWLSYIYDAPLGPTGVGFYKASKVAKESCTVMLCGQGSDEIFGGYTSYIYANQQNRLNNFLTRVLSSSGVESLNNVLSGIGRRKLFIKVGARLGLDEGKLAASYAGSLPQEDFTRFLLNGNNRLYLSLLEKYSEIFQMCTKTSFLDGMLRTEMSRGLQIILQETDRMTMATAVETRVPFLDHELVEFAISLPSSLKVRRSLGKYLPKKYLSKYFSHDFVYRKKMGFPTPIFEWFMREENAFEALIMNRDNGHIPGHFNLSYIQDFVKCAQEGRMGNASDLFAPLFRFLSLKVWHESVR